jgi:hypothetical protein
MNDGDINQLITMAASAVEFAAFDGSIANTVGSTRSLEWRFAG